MSDRSPHTIRCDDELWAEFEAFVDDAEDKSRGAKPKHLENALRAYLDQDREARIEQKVDEVLGHLRDDGAHTHTKAPDRASATVEKARRIAKRCYRNHEVPMKEADVRRAIEDIAGADDRTIEKYTGLLKERNLLYRHPNSAVWTDDREQFVSWADAVTVGETPDCLDEYDIEDEEFLDEVAEVTTDG
jgi:hypothetical protein